MNHFKLSQYGALCAIAASAISLSGQPASANLVTNGTFATDLSGWTLVASDIYTGWDASHGNPTGSFRNGNVSSIPATPSQVLGTTPGELYDISFDLYHNDPGVGDTFLASFGGTNLIGPGPIPITGTTWKTFTFNGIAAAGAATSLKFVSYDNPSYFYIDNVNVTASDVPGPLPAVGAFTAFGFSRRPAQENQAENDLNLFHQRTSERFPGPVQLSGRHSQHAVLFPADARRGSPSSALVPASDCC